MSKKQIWRVRVKKWSEQWIDVQADTPEEAEQSAASIPFVLSVFGQSAIRGDKPVGTQVPNNNTAEEEDGW
jgi:hypothetical protein